MTMPILVFFLQYTISKVHVVDAPRQIVQGKMIEVLDPKQTEVLRHDSWGPST